MINFITFIICLYLLASPFYLFPSGLPQPADILVACGGVIFLGSKYFYQTIKLPLFSPLKKLIALVLFINVVYWFYYYAVLGIDNSMYFSTLYYIFNGIFIAMLVYILKENKHSHTILLFVILFSLSIQCFLAVLGVRGSYYEAGTRGTIFFNNPNQLGYFSLLMLSLFVVLPSKYKKNRFLLFLAIFLSGYLVFYSGSRAALAGVLLLSVFMLYKEGLRLNFGTLILGFALLLATPIILNSEFISSKIDQIENRNERYEGTSVSEAQIRGYDRIYLNPEYILYGAGEGKNDRFESYHNYEIHSAFGTLLFSYGILGLLTFLLFIYKAIKTNIIGGLVILAPIIIYNLTHNGLRNALLWGLIGCLYVTFERNQIHRNTE